MKQTNKRYIVDQYIQLARITPDEDKKREYISMAESVLCEIVEDVESERDRNSDVEHIVFGIFDDAKKNEDKYQYEYCTVTDFKRRNPELWKFSLCSISKALNEIGAARSFRKRVDGATIRARYLPFKKSEM